MSEHKIIPEWVYDSKLYTGIAAFKNRHRILPENKFESRVFAGLASIATGFGVVVSISSETVENKDHSTIFNALAENGVGRSIVGTCAIVGAGYILNVIDKRMN